MGWGREMTPNEPAWVGNQIDEELARRNAEIAGLRQWVDDLQSGMYVNCVYCSHRYGPGDTTSVSMADALKDHVENCPSHPMSKLRQAIIAYVVAQGPCEDADVDEGYCPDDDCLYCQLARAVDGRRR